MEQEKMFLASAAVDLAEAEDKSYLEITNRLCYYGAPNLGNVILPIEGAEEKAKTLVNMPVVAKYKPLKVGNKKLDDLGGHEMYVDPKDHKVKFATESIGTHIAIEIKDDEVEINGEKRTLPCLFAKARIWARNEKIYSAIKRLYNAGKLFSSWEINTKKYKFDKGIKTIIDYVFLGNCFLGSKTQPSYPCAQAISMASLDEASEELAEALTLDIYKEETMAKKQEKIIAEQELVQESAQELEQATQNEPEQSAAAPETASLTGKDLIHAITKAIEVKTERWGYIVYWLPEEKIVWCKTEECKSDLDFIVFSYTVDGDKVILGEPVEKKLPIAIAQVEETLTEKDREIAEKDSALVTANNKITELIKEVGELEPFKIAAEKAALEKAEAEKAEKVAQLKAYAIKSTHISAEECESDETISKMIAELDENGIKRVIAERFMSSLQKEEEKPTVETSSVKQPVSIKTNLNSSDDADAVPLNPVKVFIS